MDTTITVIGWAGAALLLLAYGLLTARRLAASGIVYQAMNLAGGAGLMVNGAYHSAWPSAVLNVVWAVIGIAGLVAARRIHTRDADPGDALADTSAPAPIERATP